jgi:hypothetical protein
VPTTKRRQVAANGDLMSTLREQQGELVDPLSERLNELNALIATREAELVELRKMRTATTGVLRMLAPERLPETKKQQQPRRRGRPGVTPALDHLFAWLNEHNDEYPDGVSAPQIVRHESWDGASRASVTKALTLLHEQGRITLTSRKGSGGAKFYKVI